MSSYPAIILAGGLGLRLRPITEDIPKSLVEIAGRSFIAHQLSLLRTHGIRRVVIAAWYRGGMIREYVGDGSRFDMSVDYVFDGDRPLGTGGAIVKALPLLGERFFSVYGDSYLLCDFPEVRRQFEERRAKALMTVFKNEDRWDASNVEFKDGKIVAYDKKEKTAGMRHIDYGLGVFHKSAFDGLTRGVFLDLAAVYRKLLEKGELAGYEVTQRFYEIGSHEGMAELSEYLKNG